MPTSWDDEDDQVLQVLDEHGQPMTPEAIALLVAITLSTMGPEIRRAIRTTVRAVILRHTGKVD